MHIYIYINVFCIKIGALIAMGFILCYWSCCKTRLSKETRKLLHWYQMNEALHYLIDRSFTVVLISKHNVFYHHHHHPHVYDSIWFLSTFEHN